MQNETFDTLSKKEKRAMAKEIRQDTEKKKSLLSKVFKYGLALITLVLVGTILYSFLTSPDNSVTNVRDSLSPTTSDWVKGNREAKNVLYEFSDFQCPACASYQPLVKQIEKDLGNNIMLIYKHFPLTTIHKNSFKASLASEAAGKQDKFWEMHDLLFNFQNDWSESPDPYPQFEEYARSLEIDAEQFKADYNSDELKSKIGNDIALGDKLRINSTPTFYLNGKKLKLPFTLDQIKSTIKQ